MIIGTGIVGFWKALTGDSLIGLGQGNLARILNTVGPR